MYEYLFIVQAKLKADRWHRENRRLAARAFAPDPGTPRTPAAQIASAGRFPPEHPEPRTQS